MASYTIRSTGETFSGIADATANVLSHVFGGEWAPPAHVVDVQVVRGRYPYLPVCSCGHEFRGYVAEHAARTMAEAHAEEMA